MKGLFVDEYHDLRAPGPAGRPAGRVRVHLLGPIAATLDGTPLHLGPHKQREILAVLAIRRYAPVSVEQLVSDLWGDDPPRSAVNLVHTYVGRLRRLLRDDLLRSRCPGYQLPLAAGQLDTAVFETRLAQAHAALRADHTGPARDAFTQALAAWSGPRALAGTAGPLARAEQQRCAELRLDAVEHLGALRLTQGDHVGVVAELRVLVGQHPLRERLWALLMTALSYTSRRPEALLAFTELRSLLGDQLGIEPGAEATGTYRSLLAGHRPSVWLAAPLPPVVASA